MFMILKSIVEEMAMELKSPENVPHAKRSVATNVVLNLVNGLEGRGHVVVTDNYFDKCWIIHKVGTREIYVTRMMRSNHVGVPRPFNNLRNWKDSKQGTLDWSKYSSRGIFLCGMEGQMANSSIIHKCNTYPTSLYCPYLYCHHL